ncbi:MAG TPA: ATP-binding protein [Candidatus Acidoferrales bacterium]|jgi:hypothetical protein|nr:ATP-binding protein [Candidatus Acidoferrales bacterium]
MIFIERPITVENIRDVCARFNEGLRVEYKSNFDASVRDQLPKIVSSFANSQGGVLIVGIRAVNGVPQAPFEGFAAQPREEYPLTVENICLKNINPPVLPSIQVVQSDFANRVFLVIEVEESGEAPHAIENSRKVYVRTGNAANPYDLAEVDLIIDLLKRRSEPLERARRILAAAQQRSRQIVPLDRPFFEISICPTFPRRPLCTSEEVWDYVDILALTDRLLIPPNSTRRIPSGTASVQHQDAAARTRPQHVELLNYGLFFISRSFTVVRWWQSMDDIQQLAFGDLFQALVRLTVRAERFFNMHGYSGSLSINVSLHEVQGRAMRFYDNPGPFPDDPEDFRCHTNLVTCERLTTVDELRSRNASLLSGILAELTWAFWQSNRPQPVDQLSRTVQAHLATLRA